MAEILMHGLLSATWFQTGVFPGRRHSDSQTRRRAAWKSRGRVASPHRRIGEYMLFGKLVFVASFWFFSSAALSQQIIYHCEKNGGKLISDKPCAEFTAKESRRVRVEDLPPLSTVPRLPDSERQRLKARPDRPDRESPRLPRLPLFQRETQIEVSENQDINEKKCADLQYYKQHVAALRRAVDNEWLNSEHRRVTDDISRLNCGS
ncbi:MAG: hypothetical protein LBQ62_07120 [Candidatus Accumulibacter sp.]|nr:hypothetical protein [Accumulibacter sp.]